MSNVVAFRSRHSPRPTDCLRDLVTHVAAHRRSVGDVLWLKENAELLALLANAGQRVAPETLSAYADFYAGIDAQMAFFPQYYRFLLSICLDLEDLGLPGDKGAALCDFVARQGLAQAELSDLQRAEAERLLARRNVGLRDDALAARLDAFMDRSATFAIPNKKAAYELTHIVFYRARYGLARASLSEAAHRGLENAGLVAFLDQDMDLLAEVCAAQRLAGRVPPRVWEEAVRQTHMEFTFVPGSPGGTADDLHSYIVTGWASHLQGAAMLPCRVGPRPGALRMPDRPEGALRPMSRALLAMGDLRQPDWRAMEGPLRRELSGEAQTVLNAAVTASHRWEAFFEDFARATPVAATGPRRTAPARPALSST